MEGPPPQPLSAEDMLALATALLPSLLLQQTHIPTGYHDEVGYPPSAGKQWMKIEEKGMEWVAGWVRAARPDLTDACTHGLALALLSLGSRTWFQQGTEHPTLRVHEDVGDAIVVSEEAVAAFYETLHSNCVVKGLWIEGAAFGTPAAAAHLGRCLNLNSTLRRLDITVGGEGEAAARRIRRGSGSCWGEAAWTALSEALTSNATIEEVNVWNVPAGMSSHVSATFAAASQKLSALRTFRLYGVLGAPPQTATLGGIEGWGHVLKHERCTLTLLHLELLLPAQGGLVAICEALLTNTTLEMLTIGSTAYEGMATVNIEEADAEALAAMLRTNTTLTTLNMRSSGILWNAMVVEQGLSCNSSLEYLLISLDPDGAHALMALLQRPGGPITTSTATPASDASSTCPSQLNYLKLGTKEGRGFPTATALRDMLASNRTLLGLYLSYAPYSKEEWATTILPALANNQSLTKLDLDNCSGVDGELVYDAFLELLESNTCLQEIDLEDTPLAVEGRAAVVEEQIKANQEYRAALKDVPTTLTNSCRLVLCGFPYAGKSTLLDTMMQQHGHGKQHHSYSYYQHILKKWLFKVDDKLELRRRTRGIDIHPLKIQNLTMWIWDFAGQTEFHCLQDFIFPKGTSVHAAGAFVFAFNPILDSNKSGGGGGLWLKKKQHFDHEFSYWLRFICSNSKPRPSRASKPSVFVVITRKDKFTSEKERQEMMRMVKEWVRYMAIKFEHLIDMEVHCLFFVNATDKDDPEFRKFMDHIVSSLQSRISNVAKVPTICDAVATALGQGESGQQQQLEPIISIDDFKSLCKSEADKLFLQQQFNTTTGSTTTSEEVYSADKVSTAMAKAIAAYLRDAGEVFYFAELSFIVRNPRWFAHGILGYLIDIFSTYDDAGGAKNKPGGGYALWCCVKPHLEMQALRNEDRFKNGVVTKASLSDLLKEALNKVGLNPKGVNTEQLIQLMEHLDLCFAIGDGSKYLVPAIFEDKDDKAAKGERERSWKELAASSSSTRIFVTRRLECSDPIRTFVTPGFFPRLQVVLHNKAGEWAKDYDEERCILEKNLCSLCFNGMEILVEHSGSSGYFMDIMVQSYQSRDKTVEFVESKIMSSIRRLCASIKGCQGVTLAEAIIRPDCVGARGITLCRYRQSILVEDLKGLMADNPNYMHRWGAVKGEDGTHILHAELYNSQALLDGDVHGQEPGEIRAGPSLQGAPAADLGDMPKFILLTRQDVSWARDIAAKIPKAWRAEPFCLHLQCECREGHHEVKEQRGRTLYVADKSYVMMQGAGAQVAGVLAAGLQVGGLFVPGLSVIGSVASGVGQTYQPTPIFLFDIETLSQRITPAGPKNIKVPPEELRKEVEKDLQSSTEGRWLRAFLNPDAQSFETDFQLRKVQYITPPLAGSTAWLCDRHWTEGRDARSLRGL